MHFHKQAESQHLDLEFRLFLGKRSMLAHALPALAHESLLAGWIAKFRSVILIIKRSIAAVITSNVCVSAYFYKQAESWNLDLKFWSCFERWPTLASLLALAHAFFDLAQKSKDCGKIPSRLAMLLCLTIPMLWHAIEELLQAAFLL